MEVAAVKCVSIDPSASNLSILITSTIHYYISSTQDVFVELLVLWTREEDFWWCGQT
jgi:hypothetical protein